MTIIKQNPYNDCIVQGGMPILRPEDVAIVVPKYNSGTKKDADEFKREAHRFMKFHDVEGCHYYEFDNMRGRIATGTDLVSWMMLCDSIELSGDDPDPDEVDELDIIYPKVWGFFMHGYQFGIQAGIRCPTHPYATKVDKENFSLFCTAMARHLAPNAIFYACSTGDDPDGEPDTAPGSGDDSFSDYVRDVLCGLGCTFNRAFAHTKAGHLSRTPWVKFFDGQGSPVGGQGGYMPVGPNSPMWREHKKMLRQDRKSNSYRFRLPFMETRHIHEEILKRNSDRR